MSSDLVKLSVGTKSVFIAKAIVATTFPDSIIASTLELDPSTEEIVFTHPSVTPAVLDLLHSIAPTIIMWADEPVIYPGTIPNQTVPINPEAGRYLGIELLTVMSDPKYTEFMTRSKVQNSPPDLLKFSWDDYRRLMLISIQLEFIPMIAYLYTKSRRDNLYSCNHPSAYETGHLLREAITNGKPDVVKWFLQRLIHENLYGLIVGSLLLSTEDIWLLVAHDPRFDQYMHDNLGALHFRQLEKKSWYRAFVYLLQPNMYIRWNDFEVYVPFPIDLSAAEAILKHPTVEPSYLMNGWYRIMDLLGKQCQDTEERTKLLQILQLISSHQKAEPTIRDLYPVIVGMLFDDPSVMDFDFRTLQGRPELGGMMKLARCVNSPIYMHLVHLGEGRYIPYQDFIDPNLGSYYD